MKEQWTRERANEWYAAQGWLRGCNFIGSDCVNRLDMFQKYGAEAKLATADRELALCREIGFNTVRIWANFDVYYAEPESYFEIFEKYIELCAKHGQKVMVVLTHEEDLPRGDVFVPKKMGEQAYALGEHQGRIPLSEEEKAKAPRHYLEYPELREKFFTMISETVRRYARDERIICWNIYNEPGITIGARSCDILRELFALVRAEDPIQPLCADMWRGVKHGIASEEEKLAIELSDVISFHSYQSYEKLVREIRFHPGYGLEGALPDALCYRIQQEYMVPYFRAGDYSAGMVAGMRAVDKVLSGEELPRAEQDDDMSAILFALIFMAVMIILPMTLFLMHERQQIKCPQCGKYTLRVVNKQRVTINSSITRVTTILRCDNCHSEHTRTENHNHHDNGGRGGGIWVMPMGGFGGGRGGFGGGGFGGGFGGGSFGGGGSGSGW